MEQMPARTHKSFRLVGMVYLKPSFQPPVQYCQESCTQFLLLYHGPRPPTKGSRSKALTMYPELLVSAGSLGIVALSSSDIHAMTDVAPSLFISFMTPSMDLKWISAPGVHVPVV